MALGDYYDPIPVATDGSLVTLDFTGRDTWYTFDTPSDSLITLDASTSTGNDFGIHVAQFPYVEGPSSFALQSPQSPLRRLTFYGYATKTYQIEFWGQSAAAIRWSISLSTVATVANATPDNAWVLTSNGLLFISENDGALVHWWKFQAAFTAPLAVSIAGVYANGLVTGAELALYSGTPDSLTPLASAPIATAGDTYYAKVTSTTPGRVPIAALTKEFLDAVIVDPLPQLPTTSRQTCWFGAVWWQMYIPYCSGAPLGLTISGNSSPVVVQLYHGDADSTRFDQLSGPTATVDRPGWYFVCVVDPTVDSLTMLAKYPLVQNHVGPENAWSIGFGAEVVKEAHPYSSLGGWWTYLSTVHAAASISVTTMPVDPTQTVTVYSASPASSSSMTVIASAAKGTDEATLTIPFVLFPDTQYFFDVAGSGLGSGTLTVSLVGTVIVAPYSGPPLSGDFGWTELPDVWHLDSNRFSIAWTDDPDTWLFTGSRHNYGKWNLTERHDTAEFTGSRHNYGKWVFGELPDRWTFGSFTELEWVDRFGNRYPWPLGKLPGIDGIGTPPIEVISHPLAVQPGERRVSSKWLARTIHVPFVLAGPETEVRTGIRQWAKRFDPTYGEGQLSVRNTDGFSRRIYCRYTGGLELSTDTESLVSESVTLIADDPFFYDHTPSYGRMDGVPFTVGGDVPTWPIICVYDWQNFGFLYEYAADFIVTSADGGHLSISTPSALYPGSAHPGPFIIDSRPRTRGLWATVLAQPANLSDYLASYLRGDTLDGGPGWIQRHDGSLGSWTSTPDRWFQIGGTAQVYANSRRGIVSQYSTTSGDLVWELAYYKAWLTE